MFICNYCKKKYNYTMCNSLNVFITLELCPSCYEKLKSGELGREKKEKEEGYKE